MATDVGLIIAIVGSAIAIVGVVIAMMFWVRSESNDLRNTAHEDRKDVVGYFRQTRDDLIEHRKEMAQISRSIENTIKEIQIEAKDFHRRLCQIEENRKYVIYKE